MKRLQNILIFGLVILFAFWRGKAQKSVSKTRTWAIINPTPNIGDMVCVTPVFRAIKAHDANARIIVIGMPKNEEILEGNRDISRYVCNGSVVNVIKILHQEKVDAGILVNPSVRDFAVLFLGNVKRIATFGLHTAFKDREARSHRAISQLGCRVPYTPGKYVPQQYLNLLSVFGIHTTDIRKHLAFTDENKKKIDLQFKDSGFPSDLPIVAIAPSAGTKIKQWPAERFGEIANYIVRRYGLPIVIIGGPRDVEESKQMISSLENGVRYCNCVGQSIGELKATLSNVCLIIGNDSGPIYIAEAFGAATIVLVGPTDEGEHPLQDELHRVVKADERGEALLRSHLSSEDTIDLSRARAQIEAITIDSVCEQIESVFLKMKIELLK